MVPYPRNATQIWSDRRSPVSPPGLSGPVLRRRFQRDRGDRCYPALARRDRLRLEPPTSREPTGPRAPPRPAPRATAPYSTPSSDLATKSSPSLVVRIHCFSASHCRYFRLSQLSRPDQCAAGLLADLRNETSKGVFSAWLKKRLIPDFSTIVSGRYAYIFGLKRLL